MTAQKMFRGRNIVVTLVFLFIYLIYSSFQSPESTLSQILTPKPSTLPTVTETIEEDIIEEHAPDEEVDPSAHDIAGISAERQSAQVTKVVDGDTIEVSINGVKEKIRIIGLNTPETVDPRRGVQCFGREASNFAKETLTGQTVSLASDPSQTERDKYGRLLRFVFLENDTDFGKLMIQEGYGYEYTYDIPYKYQMEYKTAEQQAKSDKKGLWAENACL